MKEYTYYDAELECSTYIKYIHSRYLHEYENYINRILISFVKEIKWTMFYDVVVIQFQSCFFPFIIIIRQQQQQHPSIYPFFLCFRAQCSISLVQPSFVNEYIRVNVNQLYQVPIFQVLFCNCDNLGRLFYVTKDSYFGDFWLVELADPPIKSLSSNRMPKWQKYNLRSCLKIPLSSVVRTKNWSNCILCLA